MRQFTQFFVCAQLFTRYHNPYSHSCCCVYVVLHYSLFTFYNIYITRKDYNEITSFLEPIYKYKRHAKHCPFCIRVIFYPIALRPLLNSDLDIMCAQWSQHALITISSSAWQTVQRTATHPCDTSHHCLRNDPNGYAFRHQFQRRQRLHADWLVIE